MLLRLRIKNFKSLKDVDVRFGPFTCLVGPNGVGKSNLFDAIHFLRALAEMDLQSAALSVRTTAGGGFSPEELFWAGQTSEPIELSADMLVPRRVQDDFGRPAEPATTLLRYEVALRLSESPALRLEIARESLAGLKASDAADVIGFHHEDAFFRSVFKPTRRVGPLISTQTEDSHVRLMLHQDGGSRGQPIPAGASPRTVVGGTNAAEYPTVLAARREMESWQLLHLEPSVMRAPDQLAGPNVITERGGHIAAALERLVRGEKLPGQTLQWATNRLAELVPEVRALELDRDEVRQQLSVRLRMEGTTIPLGARAVSDGTLRFLALVTLLYDPLAAHVLCMEEPENGIHPSRVPAAVGLLHDFAVDPHIAVDEENPLRQVIINTHSPDVVRQVDAGDLLFIESMRSQLGTSSRISGIENRWRGEGVPIQRLIDFVGGAPFGANFEDLQTRLQFGSAH